MTGYLVYLLNDEGHFTHCHKIAAASDDAIIRKAASLYRSRTAVLIREGDRVVVRLTAEEMTAIEIREA